MIESLSKAASLRASSVLRFPLVLSLLALPALADEGAVHKETVLAQVGPDTITRRQVDVRARIHLTGAYVGALERGDAATQEKILAEELENEIRNRVVLQEAARQKVTLAKEDERRIERELEREALHQRLATVDQWRAQWQQLGVPWEAYLDEKRESYLKGKLIVKNISREIFVPPNQVVRYYQDHPESFPRKPRTALREIMIYFDGSAAHRIPPAVAELMKTGWGREKAIELGGKLAALARAAGADVAALASQWHMGANAERNGLQWWPSAEVPLVDPVGERASKLKPGEVSDPIVSEKGVHVILMLERRPAGTLPLADVQREIEQHLRLEVWVQRAEAWVDRLVEDAKVTITRFAPPEGEKGPAKRP